MIRTTVCALLSSLLLLAQEPAKKTEKLAPYYPTPESVVEEMLKAVGTKPGEKMFDLGSGDGRIVTAIHSGWRGVMAGVVAGAIQSMVDLAGIECFADVTKFLLPAIVPNLVGAFADALDFALNQD